MEFPVHTGGKLWSPPVLLMSLQDVTISSFPTVSGECQLIMHSDTNPGAVGLFGPESIWRFARVAG